jgi:hypothetical protein
MHVDGKEWQYKIGGFVAIRSPEGETTYIKKWDFMKIMSIKPILAWDDQQGENVMKFPVQPSDVKRYIEQHILKKKFKRNKKKERFDGSRRMAKVPVCDPDGQGGDGAGDDRGAAQQ